LDKVSIYLEDGNVVLADIKKYGSNAFLVQLKNESIWEEGNENYIIDVMVYREGTGTCIVGKGSQKYAESIVEAVKEYRKD
jgi:hypothetical protein